MSKHQGHDTVGFKMCFLLTSVLKTSAPNRHLPNIEFLAYPRDPRLFVINCLKTYLTRTKPRRSGTLPLFLSFKNHLNLFLVIQWQDGLNRS